MKLGVLCGALALLGASTSPAMAQFTTVITSPARKAAAADTMAAHRDTVMHQTTLSNMRAWVDSAAGIAASGQAVAARDTARADSMVIALNNPRRQREATTYFREGAPAPNTATPLPLLALLGAASLAAGAFLLGGRRG